MPYPNPFVELIKEVYDVLKEDEDPTLPSAAVVAASVSAADSQEVQKQEGK